MTENVSCLFPAGRQVWGNLYKLEVVKDRSGNPKKFAKGDRAGQDLTDNSIGVAYPKGATTHWSQTDWGQKLLSAGAAAYPNKYQLPTFAWKVTDGDSATPNKNGRKPCDREGYPGHWVVKFSYPSLPKLVRLDGGKVTEYNTLGGIKPGYWVQVRASFASNNSDDSVGMYVNHHTVCLVGVDAEIQSSGEDIEAIGFGRGLVLPAGVTMNSFPTAPAAALPGPSLPVPQGVALPAASAPVVPPVTQTAVQPHPSFLTPSVPLPAGQAPLGLPVLPLRDTVLTPPLPPAGPVMTAAAQGATYAQMLAAGWTDALLKQHGMVA